MPRNNKRKVWSFAKPGIKNSLKLDWTRLSIVKVEVKIPLCENHYQVIEPKKYWGGEYKIE